MAEPPVRELFKEDVEGDRQERHAEEGADVTATSLEAGAQCAFLSEQCRANGRKNEAQNDSAVTRAKRANTLSHLLRRLTLAVPAMWPESLVRP